MEYATGWRMALEKELFRKDEATAEIAQRVGYGSASAFNVALTRHVGQPPGAYSGKLLLRELMSREEVYLWWLCDCPSRKC
jgi:AraC-like DNA-binding protein